MIGIAWLKTQTNKLKTKYSIKKDRTQGPPGMVPPVSHWTAVKIATSGEIVRAQDRAHVKKHTGTGMELKRKEAAACAPRARKKEQDRVNSQANPLFS